MSARDEQPTFKRGARVRLREHPSVEGTFRGYATYDNARVEFDFSADPVGNCVRLYAIEPVPPPAFDPAELRDEDLVQVADYDRPLWVTQSHLWLGYQSIMRVWRLDHSGDYKLIFPPREVQ